MFVDYEWLASRELPPVAIVGSGPAGVSLALALEERGIESLILEAGDMEYDSDIQDVYNGRVEGDEYFALDSTRMRVFGGSSSHWTGYCRTLDSHDFLPRENVEHTGWPITRSDLEPYLARTNEILETDLVGHEPDPDEAIGKVDFSYSDPPVHFGQKYQTHIGRSDRIHACLRAPVLRLIGDGQKTSGVEIALPDGRTMVLTASTVVVATGGIENSRLLLWSNETSESPVVPNSETLGRYWMEHPHFDMGEADVSDSLIDAALSTDRNAIYFAPGAEALARYGILNGVVRFEPTFAIGGTAKRYARKMACLVEPLGRAAWEMMDRKLWCGVAVRMSWEQAPDPGNRITLSESERDSYGIPRTLLTWRKTEIDYRTPKVIMELFGRHLLDSGEGMLQLRRHVIDENGYPHDDELAGHHHMGGTRMSVSAQDGVVDANLKIHGNANTYVLGSSVFPTSGYANPTFSIVQLALRLGSHLADKLSR